MHPMQIYLVVGYLFFVFYKQVIGVSDATKAVRRNRGNATFDLLFVVSLYNVDLQLYLWQSWVDLEHYSIAHFNRITVFEVL